jgi:hypothetical protein
MRFVRKMRGLYRTDTDKWEETLKQAFKPTKRDGGLSMPMDGWGLPEIVMRRYGLKGPGERYHRPVERPRNVLNAGF